MSDLFLNDADKKGKNKCGQKKSPNNTDEGVVSHPRNFTEKVTGKSALLVIPIRSFPTNDLQSDHDTLR